MDRKHKHDAEYRQSRLETLFQENYRAVASYVRRRIEPDRVEDVVAETFLVAWRRLDDVPADARPWLLGVARKTLATHRRSTGRQRALLERLEMLRQSGVEQDAEASELGVAAAFAGLSEADREALTLIGWDGLTPRQAAAALSLPPSVFRVRLHRAKQRFRRLLEAGEATESARVNVMSLITQRLL